MKDDLISRQAAKNKKVYSEERHEYVIPVAEIDWLPSAQPEIIRCPDCYYNDGTAYCKLHFRNVKVKDFCSWAERRE